MSKATVNYVPSQLIGEADDIELSEADLKTDPDDMARVVQELSRSIREGGTPPPISPLALKDHESSDEEDEIGQTKEDDDESDDEGNNDDEATLPENLINEVLSQSSEIRAHDSKISTISGIVQSHSAQISKVTALDATVRNLSDKVDRLTGELNDAKLQYSESLAVIKNLTLSMNKVNERLSALDTSMNSFVTNMAEQIADVERRAAKKQLREDPPMIQTDIVPPSVIEMKRSVPSSSSVQKPSAPQKKKALNFDDM